MQVNRQFLEGTWPVSFYKSHKYDWTYVIYTQTIKESKNEDKKRFKSMLFINTYRKEQCLLYFCIFNV